MLVLPVVVDTVSNALGLPPQQLGAFAALKGNTFEYLVLLLPVSWGIAAFGEELLYRGFVYRRLTDAIGQTSWASTIALLGKETPPKRGLSITTSSRTTDRVACLR